MPERDTSPTPDEAQVNKLIQQELEQQEQEATALVNEELAMSGTDAVDVIP